MENNNTTLQVSPANNINDVIRMGKLFFESGMFADVKSLAQAVVKVQVGAELGIPPFQSMAGVNVIAGKPSIGAGLMASKVDQHPNYDYEVLQQTNEVCELRFFKNGKERGTSKFTIQDARKAGTKNLDKFPANMLFARAMSNGVRWYCPGVFSGPVYTPEELGDTTIDTSHEVLPPAKPAAVKIEAAPAQPANEPEALQDLRPEILDLLQNPAFTEKERTDITKQLNNMIAADQELNLAKLKETVYNRELGYAIVEMGKCKDAECAAATWKKFRHFQNAPSFIKAKDEKKTALQAAAAEAKPATAPATFGSPTKDKLIDTLKSPYFTKAELNKELLTIHKITEEAAAEKLDYYATLFEDRIRERVEAAQELYDFIIQNSEALGQDEFNKFSNMCDNMKVPVTALRAAKEEAALIVSELPAN